MAATSPPGFDASYDPWVDTDVFYLYGLGPFTIPGLRKQIKLQAFLETAHPEILAEFETFYAVDERLHNTQEE